MNPSPMLTHSTSVHLTQRIVSLLLSIVVLSVPCFAQRRTAAADNELKLVVALFRHGVRSPEPGFDQQKADQHSSFRWPDLSAWNAMQSTDCDCGDGWGYLTVHGRDIVRGLGKYYGTHYQRTWSPSFNVYIWADAEPRLSSWNSQSWTNRTMSAFAAMKRNAPSPLKKLYYSVTPPTTTYKLARPTMLPAYDWENTRAFSLPTDQYGWIRINLIGREAAGIVATDEYEDLCSELTEMLSTQTSEAGEPLVNDVLRTAPDVESARVNPLPDLVIHWRDAAFLSSLKIKGSKVLPERVSKKTTGQHSPLGFCIYRGAQDAGVNGQIAAKDLWRVIAANLVNSES